MFDLNPVRLSARSRYVKFTDEMEQALSPERHLDQLNARSSLLTARSRARIPASVARFRRGSKDAGNPVQLLVAEGYNHFQIIETLASPHSVLGRAVLEQMSLTHG